MHADPLPIPAPRLIGRSPQTPVSYSLPTLSFRACCGFPSPAEDFLSDDLDLTALVVSNPPATFYAIAEGDSMQGFGIYAGDTLVIDRSLQARDQDIALVLLDGGLMVKQLRMRRHHVELVSGNPDHATIAIHEDQELQVWGVITWSFRKHLRR